MLQQLIQLSSVQLGTSAAVGRRTNHDPLVKVCSSADGLHRALSHYGGERRKPIYLSEKGREHRRVTKHGAPDGEPARVDLPCCSPLQWV